MAILVDRYRKLSIRRMIIILSITFIKKCLQFNITPTFAKVKISRNVTSTDVSNLERKILRRSLRSNYARLHKTNINLKLTYDELTSLFSWNYLNDALHNIEDEVNIAKFHKQNCLNKKFDNLCKKQQHLTCNNVNNVFSDHKFHCRVLNMSNISFSETELDFLGLGLKFSLHNNTNKKMLEKHSIDLDVLIEGTGFDHNVKNIIRNSCVALLQKDLIKGKNTQKFKKRFNEQFSALKSIKNKISTNNLVISKADKGNCIVIMHKDNYVNKVENFLVDNGFIPLTKNPLQGFINKTKKIVNDCSLTINKYCKFKLTISNPVIPLLYGLPKIHKVNCPIRPVVSFFNTPVSKLSSFLDKTIRSLTNFQPLYSVKNTLDFVDKLKSVTIKPNYHLVSFDVCNLFTTVPRDETLPLVSKLLDNIFKLDFEKSDIMTMLKFCLSQDFFQFNNKIYRQPEGLAMGSPLSPFLADLFMNNLETQYVHTNNKIIFWARYVDDCFAIVEGPLSVANDILSDLNSLHSNIKFTLETECDNKLNFLDLSISRNLDSLEFGIYRKPTQTDHAIHYRSMHPWQHKMSAFYAYVHRLLKVPLSQTNYIKELNIIKQIAVNNGYYDSLIDKLVNKCKNKIQSRLAFSQQSNNPTPNFINRYISVPYFGNISNKISKLINFHASNSGKNITVAFKTFQNLGSILINSKDKKVNHLQKSGVYKLKCNNCPATYVGKTIRPLKIRISEHLNDSKTSSFKTHLQSNNHTFSESTNSEILHEYNTNFSIDLRLSLLEDLEIQKELSSNTDNCNKQLDLNCKYFTPIFKNLFLNQNSRSMTAPMLNVSDNST